MYSVAIDPHRYSEIVQTNKTQKCTIGANCRSMLCIKHAVSAMEFSTLLKGDIKGFSLWMDKKNTDGYFIPLCLPACWLFWAGMPLNLFRARTAFLTVYSQNATVWQSRLSYCTANQRSTLKTLQPNTHPLHVSPNQPQDSRQKNVNIDFIHTNMCINHIIKNSKSPVKCKTRSWCRWFT